MVRKFLFSICFLLVTIGVAITETKVEFKGRYRITDLTAKAKVTENNINTDVDFKADFGLKAIYLVAKGKEGAWQKNARQAYQFELLWQRRFEDFPIWDVAISPEGRLLAVAGGSEYLIDKLGGVHLVRATDGASLKFLSLGKGNYVSRVAFSPDGTLLALESADHEVSLWRVDSGSLVQKKGSKKDLESFLSISRSSVSPDGKLVAKVEDVVIEDAPECGGLLKIQQKMVVRWVEDGRVAWEFAGKFQCESPDAPPSSHSSAVFSPDGSLLALAGRDGIIRIWSVKDRKLVGTLKMPAVYSLAFSKDGKLLAAGALTVPGEVRLWRVEKSKKYNHRKVM